MLTAEPDLIALNTTSHSLFETLTATLSLVKETPSDKNTISLNRPVPPYTTETITKVLAIREWPGWFHLIWLDFCGSLVSKAGRARQRDLELLFSQKMIRTSSILIVTCSERGSTPLYAAEVVDQIMLIVQQLASTHSIGIECKGVL